MQHLAELGLVPGLGNLHAALLWGGLWRSGSVPRLGSAQGFWVLRVGLHQGHRGANEEGRLGDPVLRESFVKRVFIYKRWQDMVEGGLDWAALTDFHARHKLILYSHDQDLGRKLGRELSGAHDQPVADYAQVYLSQLMAILKIYAKRSNHVNVLEHIRGYLKRDLDKSDKQELTETIEKYRRGLLPLIVPITLLRHHFRKNPNEYIERSYYMQPHPDELMLLNSL